MQRKVWVAVSLALISCSSILLARKAPHPAIPPMTAEQKALHVLNRLTFGPRPGDLDAVKKTGLDRWIELQLHPRDIPENPVLETRLASFDTLRMSPSELVRRYPTPQMVKAMIDGRRPLPSDPDTRYMIEKLMARVQHRDAAGALPADWPLDDPPQQVALLESLPPAEQYEVLDALPNNARGKLYAAATPDLRRKLRILNGPVQVVNQDLTDAKILRAIYSERQLEEVLTDFWYNHFNVFLNKGADRYMATAYERDAIRPHVLGRFKDLLVATAESPAMLFYLDNWQSKADRLNENYGRELMELHTLGVDGGYTQRDVTEVARCFTGWTIRQPRRGGGFEFVDRIHDKGEKHVLGVAIPAGGGMSDGLKVLDILARHPSTARFISRSLAIRFVSDDPPETLVERMAKTFEKTDGDLLEVMRTMLSAPEFRDPANFRAKLKSPLEMVASAVRAGNGEVDFAEALAAQLNQMGEPLYRKLEPTGYSNRGADWINSASLLARMNFSLALARDKIPGVKVDPARFERDATGTAPDGQRPPAALAAGLILGSPEFQRK